MPVYEYRCKDCGKTSGFLEGVGKGETEIKCRHCGSAALEKAFSVVNVPKSGKTAGPHGGLTCCGRTERCGKPPCSDDGACKR